MSILHSSPQPAAPPGCSSGDGGQSACSNPGWNSKLPNGCKPISAAVSDGGATTPCSRLSSCCGATCKKCIQFNCRPPSATAVGGDVQEYSLLFEPDALTDCFQIGRAAYSSNDFVVPGELHYGPDCLPSGPVSRRSCRIVCDRLPPYQCYLFAGGFSEEGVSGSTCGAC